MASFNGFRVVCDLSEFFSDIRRKLLIYVDPSKDRCIADLVLRVKTLAGLCENPNIVFAIGDCLLPMTEDIRILHQEDILKATNTDILPVFENDHENNPELCKQNHNDNDKSRKKKKKRKKVSESESLQTEENVIQGEIDVETSVTDSGPAKEVVNPILAIPNVNDSNCKPVASPGDDSLDEMAPSAKKRKRTRVRVRQRQRGRDKNKVPVDSSTHRPTNVGNVDMSSINFSKPVFSHCSARLKHIRFSDDSDDKREETCYETLELSEAVPIGTQNEPHSSIPFRHNVALQSTVTQWDIKHPTSTNNEETVEIGNMSLGDYVGNQTHNMFSKLLALANSTPLVVKHSRPPIVEVPKTPLQGFPKDGDILTFKILRMDENYCPQVSNPITAKVLLYSNITNEVSVEILDGRDQCQQPKGKFDIETDEDETETLLPSVIQLNWNEIIEPFLNAF